MARKMDGETECRFRRPKNQVKHSILIGSGRECFETFKVVRLNLLMVNCDNKRKQIYKIK